MNDQPLLGVGQYTSPNSHDTDQLNTNYSHVDPSAGGDGGGDTGGGGGCPPGNPNHPKCNPDSSTGRWITVHVFWAD